MQTPRSRQLPRKVTISLLRLYIVMGLASIVIGVNLCMTAYHMRMVDGLKQGTGYVILVGTVVIGFGLWRCALAIYHLRRIRSAPR
jgi:hypothetical protein